MDRFKCYRCEEACTSMTEIVIHCTLYHEDQSLKYRELVLDEYSGKYGYRSKTYPDIVPNDLKRKNKAIVVKDEVVIIQNSECGTGNVKTPLKSKSIENIENIQTDPSWNIYGRPKFKCVYCDASFETLEEMIEHCCLKHSENGLKYRELCLDTTETKKYGYKSILHEGIIPVAIKRSGKEILVKDNIVIIRQKQSSRGTVNTPVKLPEYIDEIPDDIELDTQFSENIISTDEAIDEMKRILPQVLSSLFENGKLESYVKFNRLIYEGKLPNNNICYLLFNDLIEWFSSSNTSQMRYQKDTVKFWQLGYRLFHGKFLRFMSGLRNFGQVLDDTAGLGEMNPEDSRINFAVPALKNLHRKDDETEPIYPGICEKHMETLSKVLSHKPLKLCVDGKKISRGKGKKMGDIDCWGYESKPTLQEKQNESKMHIEDVMKIQAKLDHLMEDGIQNMKQLSPSDKSDLHDSILHEIKSLAGCNKLLREKADSLEHLETKLKTMGGKDWMTFRYYPAICSVRTSRCSMVSHIAESLKLTNELSYYAATLNDKQSVFQMSDTVMSGHQPNYFELNDSYITDNTRYIKQRTDRWFDIRSKAMVTGSTCHKSLGLGKLKEQQAHYDQVILKKDRSEFSEEVQERMRYGTVHEVDAIATVCAKVLPAIYPDLNMFEEGCICMGYKENDCFMVVSPDGSLKSTIEDSTKMSYENKCKSPTSYSRNAYYSIPLYYIPQVLCEMNSSTCDTLLFTCWSEESMTVFEVNNDIALWNKCWSELTNVYASEDKSRPKHFSTTSKELREDVKVFRETHTKLIGEFPSVKVLKSGNIQRTVIDTMQPYITPKECSSQPVKTVELSIFQDTTVRLKKWFLDSYEHLRSVASEILVFMVTDLDRIYDMESENAHVVGYALKGPSMKNEVLRHMMQDIIAACERHGLNICVTSSDGQWHIYGVQDDKQLPLTVHQLQRKLWSKLRSLDKTKLQSMFRKLCIVQTVDDVVYEKSKGILSLLGHRYDRAIRFQHDEETDGETGRITEDIGTMNVHTAETENEGFSEDLEAPNTNATETGYYGCLYGDFEETVGPETANAIDRVFDSEQITDTNDSDVYAVPTDVLYTENESLVFDLNNQSIDELYSHSGEYVNEAYMFENQQDDRTINIQSTSDERVMGNFQNISTVVEVGQSSSVFGDACRVLNQEDWDIGDTYLGGGQYSADEYPSENTEETFARYDREVQNSVSTTPCVDMAASHFPEHSITAQSEMNLNQTPETVSKTLTEYHSVIQMLNADMFAIMLHDLQHDRKCLDIRNWLDIDLDRFIEMCSNKETMNKNLQKREVYICAKCIERECKTIRFKVTSNCPKYRLLAALYEVQGEIPKTSTAKRRKISVTSLKDLCWNILKLLSKDQLMILLAGHKWEDEFKAWKLNCPVPYGISIPDVADDIQWFTQPRLDADGIIRFHFTDACHLLTCLRTKLCTSGIYGLQRKAWEIAALSKDTKLNVSVVVDCVDKQDVALARRVFAEDVEKVIESKGYEKEARFCRLIRRWYDAEDEPAISAVDRCQRRIELLRWLLEGYRIGKFPPPTRYVKGIPIITYEAMICHLERKLQLYAFVPGSMFNVRATGTQEVEQLFSSFRDMDPSGSGTVKPDVITGMLASAIQIDNFRLDPEKPFFIKTSGASVYPSHSSGGSDMEGADIRESFIRTPREALNIQTICPCDHAFDSKVRKRRSQRRPSGIVSQPGLPAHGERGVRQFHRRDDSKILAHRRLGFMDMPDP